MCVSDLGRRFRINKAVAMSHPKYALTLGDPVFYSGERRKRGREDEKGERKPVVVESLSQGDRIKCIVKSESRISVTDSGRFGNVCAV